MRRTLATLLAAALVGLVPATPAAAATVAPTVTLTCPVVLAIPEATVQCTYRVVAAPGKPTPRGITLSQNFQDGFGGGWFFHDYDYAGETNTLTIGPWSEGPTGWQIEFRPAADQAGIYRSSVSAIVVIDRNPRYDFPPFVDAVYEDLLGRPADAGGRNGWSAALAGGANRAGIALSILGSVEGSRKRVDAAYLRLLDRLADPTGRDAWAAALRGGMTMQQLEAELIASAEFWSKAGATVDGFIDRLYDRQLGRGPDGGGQAGFRQLLGTNPTAVQRRQAGSAFALSTERLSKVVDAFYVALLDRHGDRPGIDGWVRAIQAGASEELVQAQITASNEYIGRALAG